MAPPKELRFITMSNDTQPAGLDSASRRLVRTTAGHAARYHDASEHSHQHHKQSIATRAASQRGGMNRFRSQPVSVSARTDSPFSVEKDSSPLHDHLSVWDPIVGPLGRQAWDLLHYYRHFFRAGSWALHAKKDWFAFVIEDPAAIHATLSFVALNRDLDQGFTISPWTLAHRQKALQLVRRELAQQRHLPQDALIGAVALLAVTEGLEGHSLSASAHVKALSKLVHLRGGFAKLQDNEALSKLVVWADLCYVSTFPSTSQIPSLSDRADMMRDQLDTVGQHTFLETMKWIMPDSIFRMLKMLVIVPKYPPTEDTTSQQRQDVNQLIYDLNQSLLSISREQAVFDDGPVGKLAKTLCFSAHLYIGIVLRQMPRRAKAIVERAAKLKDALHELESVAVWETSLIEAYLVIGLWAHTLHFCSLVAPLQARPQDAVLEILLSTLSILNLEQFCQQLTKISWVKLSFDHELSHLLEYRQ